MNKLFMLFIFSLSHFATYAQSSVHEVVATAGNSNQTNNIQIDWTLGEVAISTLSGSSSLLTQGFHQPNYIITATKQLPTDWGDIKIYPNPTADQLNINFMLLKKEKVELVLFDLAGKIIQKNTFVGQKINKKISLSAIPSGTYFLSMKIGNQTFSQTHKIQKIN